MKLAPVFRVGTFMRLHMYTTINLLNVFKTNPTFKKSNHLFPQYLYKCDQWACNCYITISTNAKLNCIIHVY